MTKRVGYTEIIAPTPAEIADLERRLQSGELLRVVFENDGAGNVIGAHFRRNHHYEGAPEKTPPIAWDPGLSITDAAESIRTFGKACDQATLSLAHAKFCNPAASFRSENVLLSQTRIRGTLASKKRRDRIPAAEFFLLLFAAMGIGAIIAILTR